MKLKDPALFSWMVWASSACVLSAGNLLPNGSLDDDQISVVYDTRNGNLSLDNGGWDTIATFELKSASGVFTGPKPPLVLDGIFDIFSPQKIFKLDPAGFGAVDLGPVTAPSLSVQFLLDDFFVGGACVADRCSGLGSGTTLVYVPELGTAFHVLAIIIIMSIRRNRLRP